MQAAISSRNTSKIPHNLHCVNGSCVDVIIIHSDESPGVEIKHQTGKETKFDRSTSDEKLVVEPEALSTGLHAFEDIASAS